jgi:hypothetical protein
MMMIHVCVVTSTLHHMRTENRNVVFVVL